MAPKLFWDEKVRKIVYGEIHKVVCTEIWRQNDYLQHEKTREVVFGKIQAMLYWFKCGAKNVIQKMQLKIKYAKDIIILDYNHLGHEKS